MTKINEPIPEAPTPILDVVRREKWSEALWLHDHSFLSETSKQLCGPENRLGLAMARLSYQEATGDCIRAASRVGPWLPDDGGWRYEGYCKRKGVSERAAIERLLPFMDERFETKSKARDGIIQTLLVIRRLAFILAWRRMTDSIDQLCGEQTLHVQRPGDVDDWIVSERGEYEINHKQGSLLCGS